MGTPAFCHNTYVMEYNIVVRPNRQGGHLVRGNLANKWRGIRSDKMLVLLCVGGVVGPDVWARGR